MAASVFKTSDKCILNMVEGATGILRNGGTYKLAFVTNSWTPSLTDTELWGDTGLSTNEIAGTGGYTTGGQALDSVTLAVASGVVKFDAADEVFTATSGGIAAWRYGVIYYAGTLNSKANPVVCWFEGVDGAGSDVAATTDGNTLTIAFNASGILSVNQA